VARPASSIVREIEAGVWLRRGAPALAELGDPAAEASVGRLIGNRPARWWAVAAVWLTVALSVGLGLFVNFQAQGRDVPLVDALMAMVPHYFFWALVSPPLYRALHRTICGGRRVLSLSTLFAWSAIALAGSTAMSFASYVLRHDLEPTLGQLMDIYVAPPAGPAFWAMNFSILGVALVAFTGVRSLRLRDHALWTAAQTELRGARLEAQLADARLQALQAQMNPHFVLNSLNAIAGLVQVGERDRAADAIGRLGDLFKVVLRHGRGLDVTFGDEIDFLERYLKLCELRYGAQLQYAMSIPAQLRERRVPALIVQPLVENAIRHGMAPPLPLHLEIRAYVRGGALVIEVEDDGRGIGEAAAVALPAGHGLANLRERLRLSFGSAAALHLEARASGGTHARIVIGD
jgi:two-component system LytT family sensor kinase